MTTVSVKEEIKGRKRRGEELTPRMQDFLRDMEIARRGYLWLELLLLIPLVVLVVMIIIMVLKL